MNLKRLVVVRKFRLVVFVCLWIFPSCLRLLAASEPGNVPIPSQEIILSTLKKAHPRLLVSQADFFRLQGEIQTNALLNKWFSQIKGRAEKILQEPPSEYVIPDGLRLLETSRRVLDRAYTLALVYQVTHEERFAKRAWSELEAAGHFPDWNTKHFLDTAEMTHAFAIGYDWLYDFWIPEQRAFLKSEIVKKGLEPGLEVLRKKTGWAVVRHNWNQVCNGGLGMGALAIADVEPVIAGELLQDALTSIQMPMAEFAPDGAWKEGPAYWEYATSYNVTFLAALNTALGTDFGLSDIPGFSETGSFPIYVDGPCGQSFNFADCGTGNIRGAQLFWLGRRFNHPEYCALEQKFAKPTVQDLIWFAPQRNSDALKSLPLDKYYRGAEVVCFRSDWQDEDAIFMAFKAGDNAVNHSHLDLGSFVLDALGERWAVGLTKEDYNLPGYFGNQRWNYYRLRAEGHNTLVLNPNAGPDQNPAAKARIVQFQSRPKRAFAIADLTPAYQAQAQKVQRGIALLDRKDILIQDEIQTRKPADLWWFMHTAAEVEISGNRAVLKIGEKKITAQILSPQGAVFECLKAEPFATSPHPDKQSNNDNFRKLTVHLPQSRDVQLAILFTTGAENQQAPLITPLSKWQDVLAKKVEK